MASLGEASARMKDKALACALGPPEVTRAFSVYQEKASVLKATIFCRASAMAYKKPR